MLIQETIRPSADLRNHYNEISRQCKEGKEAVIITVNGRGDTVSLAYEEYRRMKARIELLELLSEADDDVKNGRVDGSIIIGRHSSCGMVINDAGISGQHCRISEDGGVLMIEDLGSTNGTIVNGMTIPGKTKLTSGDLIMLGNKEYRISF